MQLRHFRYFIAVAEEGSFIKAARRLRVSQPTLSKQIQDLEHEIGVSLLERLPRGVKLTASGKALLAEARSTIESAARAVSSARRAHEEGRNRLQLAHARLNHVTPIVASLLTRFRQGNPAVQVDTRFLHESAQRAAVREQNVDVAITFVTDLPVPGFNSHALVDCSVTGVMLPASHPLATQAEVSLSELQSLTWLHPDRRESPELVRNLRNAFRQRGLTPSRRDRTDPLLAAFQIASGNAWYAANPGIADYFTKYFEEVCPNCVYRPFVEAPIPVWMTLIWHPDSTPPLVERLVGAAKEMNLSQNRVPFTDGGAPVPPTNTAPTPDPSSSRSELLLLWLQPLLAFAWM